MTSNTQPTDGALKAPSVGDATINLSLKMPQGFDLAAERIQIFQKVCSAFAIPAGYLGTSIMSNAHQAYLEYRAALEAQQQMFAAQLFHVPNTLGDVLRTIQPTTIDVLRWQLANMGLSHCTPWSIARRKIVRYWRNKQ